MQAAAATNIESSIIHIRHLRYFVKIVEAGSFSRAAATIFVAQPALSQQIAELEEELGVVLLHRSARGVRPTAAGEALHREAVSILRQIERLPDIVRFTGGEVAGTVSLGMASTLASFLAGAFMKACKTALPMVNLNLVTDDSVSLKARIAGQALDLAILFDEASTPGLRGEALFRQRLYMVDRKQGSSGNPRSISLEQLGARPLVMASAPNATRVLLDGLFAKAAITPEVVAESNMLHGILAAVQSGVGVSVIPMGDITAATGIHNVVAIPIEPAIYQTAHVVTSDDAALNRAGEAVRDLLGPFVRRFLEENAPKGMSLVD